MLNYEPIAFMVSYKVVLAPIAMRTLLLHLTVNTIYFAIIHAIYDVDTEVLPYVLKPKPGGGEPRPLSSDTLTSIDHYTQFQPCEMLACAV